MLKHMEGLSKRHSSAVKYKSKENYYKIGKKPLWRTNWELHTIGVVQTKCAEIYYEPRIAELYQARAEVGDFGHKNVHKW